MMNSHKAGFSLFETLLAFAIMTSVLSVILAGQSQLSQRMGSSHDEMRALKALRSGVDYLSLAPEHNLSAVEQHLPETARIIAAPLELGPQIQATQFTVSLEGKGTVAKLFSIAVASDE